MCPESVRIVRWDVVVVVVVVVVVCGDLRKQEESGQLVQPVLFVLLVLVSVLLYFAVSLMDPGFILSDDTDALQVTGFARCSWRFVSLMLCVDKVDGD